MSASKKKTGTDVAVVDSKVPAKSDAALPDFLKSYSGRTGAEGIESNDVTIPRVMVGQAMTQAVKDGELAEGDIYLNIGHEKLVDAGKPLPVVILATIKEYILWRPQEDNGGGVLARARKVVGRDGEVRFKWDKPNQSFDVKVGGKIKVTWKTKEYLDQDGLGEYGSEIPGDSDSGRAATLHYNYIVALPSQDDMLAAISLSKSKERKGRDLNSLLKRQAQAKGIPIWSLAFNLASVDDKNQSSQEYKNVEFTNNGYVPDDKFAFYTGIANSLASKNVTFDQSDDGESEGKSGPKAL